MPNYSQQNGIVKDGKLIIDILFCLVAALTLPIFLIYSYSLDDIQAFSAIQQRTYFELAFGSHGWSGTVFYRPLIDLQTKLIWDVFSSNYFAFKGYQFGLFAVFLICLRHLAKQLAIGIWGACVLLAMILSSRAVHDAFLWWVNMGQAVVLVCFVGLLIFLAERFALESNSNSISNIFKAAIFSGISALAIFSKETGLVVLIGFSYLSYLEKNRLAIGMLLTVFVLFAFARLHVIGVIGGGDAFMANSGFGFSFLSSKELQEVFEGNKYLYYAYNAASQFFYTFLRQPVEGQFATYGGGFRGIATFIYAAAAFFIIISIFLHGVGKWTALILFLLTSIIFNSILSFPYARERIMNVADISCAIIFALAASHSYSKINTSIRPIFFKRFSAAGAAFAIITTVSLLRGFTRFKSDFAVSISGMSEFVTGDYSRILESSIMPSMVRQNVIDDLSSHYYIILQVVNSAIEMISLQ